MAVLLLSFIQATLHGGVQGGAKVQAPMSAPATLNTINVGPNNLILSPDAVQAYFASGTYSDGSQADVTSQCTWSSSNTTVAQIGAPASPQPVNALSIGTSNIQCAIGTLVGSAALTVAGLAVTTVNIPLGTVGNPYSATFTASGGTLPYTFSITTGLSNLTGIGLGFTSPILSGTPTAQGNYGFTLQVHDSSTPPLTVTYNYVLLVNAIAPSIAGGHAKLPKVWVNTHEPDPSGGIFDVNKTIHADGSGDYPCSMAGLNQSMRDWATSGIDQSERLVIDSAHSPRGQCRITGLTGTNTNSTILIPTKVVNGNAATKYFVIESSTPNPPGEAVCAGVGNQGNPLLMVRNPGCVNGPSKANMWYVTSNSQAAYGNILQFGGWNAASNWGPNHVVIRDAEIEITATGASTFVLETSPSSTDFGSRAAQPRPDIRQYGTNFGIERSYIHGDYGDDSRSPKGLNIITLLNFMAAKQWIAWDYVEGIAMPNSESHITGDNYSPPGQKIVGNWLEGAAVNLFWGGSTGITTLYPPGDIEIRRNVITHNPAWMFTACGQQGAKSLGIKGNMEVKNGERMLVNGNIYQYSFVCGQNGQLLTFNVRASSAGLWGDNYLVNISDITVTNNIFRYANAGIQLDGRSSGLNAGQGATWPARRWTFINNLFYGLGSSSVVPNSGNNVVSGGAGNLTFSVASVSRVQGIAELVLVNGGTGRQQTMYSPGDPVAVTGCSGIVDPSFNTPNPTTAIGPSLTTDTTNPFGLTISYPNAGPDVPVTVAVGGGCQVHSKEGWPEYFTFSHNTAMFSGALKWPNNAMPATPVPSVMRHSTYQDNLITPNLGNPTPTGGWYGWMCCSVTEGNNTIRAGWDINTLTADHNTWPSRFNQRGNYTERNPTCSAAGSCISGGNAASTLWFPATVQCPNATVGTSDCIGYHGMMNGAAYLNLSTNPFVDYSLVPDSPYKAGNARQAHDGTDMGVSMPALQNAFSETKYSGCSTVATDANYCGPTGPYPD